MVIKKSTGHNNKENALDLLDDENAAVKKTTTTSTNINSVTEELARSLMDHLYDELKKRTGEISALQHGAYQRSEEMRRPPTFNKPPGLWGRREVQPGHVPGLWGREVSSRDNDAWSRSANEGPIPGMWGREVSTNGNGSEQ